jgi:hypothetical protein
MVKRHIALAALAVVALAFVACDDPVETGRVIIDIKEFNGGMPVQSDVLHDVGSDPADTPYIPEDIIPVVLTARPYNDFITGNEHFQIIIEEYTIRWTRTDGGTGALPTRTENAHIVVGVNTETEAAFRLTTWADKAGAILAPLAYTSNTVLMRADIEFRGREMGTEKDVEFGASVSVNFADAANEE